MNKSLYSVSDLSAYLGVSHTLIRRWCNEGKIPYGLIDNQIKFSLEMVLKIKTWYQNDRPKIGRPNKPENIFSITQLSKELNIEPSIIRNDISMNQIYISSNGKSSYFTKEQFDEAKKYYSSKNIKGYYTPNDVAEKLGIDNNLLRFLCKIGRIKHTKTETNRFLFSLEEFNLLKKTLDMKIPLLDKDELEKYQKEKSEYYKDWYDKNKKELKEKRRLKRINKQS